MILVLIVTTLFGAFLLLTGVSYWYKQEVVKAILTVAMSLLLLVLTTTSMSVQVLLIAMQDQNSPLYNQDFSEKRNGFENP